MKRFLLNFLVPVMFAGGYAGLAITSDASNSIKAWMAIGFGFVVVTWFLFRTLSETAGLTRALTMGDAPRIRALADAGLRSRRSPAARAPFVVHRAYAAELEGDFAAALAQLGELPAIPDPPPPWSLRAAAIKLGAQVELGDLAAARATLDGEVAPRAARLGAAGRVDLELATARVALAEGTLADALPRLERLRRDLRAGDAVRAIACACAARASASDPARAAALIAEAAALAPGTWMARST